MSWRPSAKDSAKSSTWWGKTRFSPKKNPKKPQLERRGGARDELRNPGYRLTEAGTEQKGQRDESQWRAGKEGSEMKNTHKQNTKMTETNKSVSGPDDTTS